MIEVDGSLGRDFKDEILQGRFQALAPSDCLGPLQKMVAESPVSMELTVSEPPANLVLEDSSHDTKVYLAHHDGPQLYLRVLESFSELCG